MSISYFNSYHTKLVMNTITHITAKGVNTRVKVGYLGASDGAIGSKLLPQSLIVDAIV